MLVLGFKDVCTTPRLRAKLSLNVSSASLENCSREVNHIFNLGFTLTPMVNVVGVATGIGSMFDIGNIITFCDSLDCVELKNFETMNCHEIQYLGHLKTQNWSRMCGRLQ